MDWISILKHKPTLGSMIWAKDGNGMPQLGYADLKDNKLALKDINGLILLDCFIHWATWDVIY